MNNQPIAQPQQQPAAQSTQSLTVKTGVGDTLSTALCCFGWSLMAFGGDKVVAGAAVMSGLGACCGDNESTIRVNTRMF